jgi:Fe-Mn family superoxide dismutase
LNFLIFLTPMTRLRPYMSKETLEFHHDKHHMAYVTNGNNLLNGFRTRRQVARRHLQGKPLPRKTQGLVNNVGQHYNHVHFWSWMKPNGGGKSLPGALQKAVDADLGGYDKMREDFIKPALRSSAPAGPGLRSRMASWK